MPPTPSGGVRPRCPTCGKPVDWAGNRARPFCSIRCKLIDLGGWLDETYRIPPEPAPEGTRPDDRAARER